MPRQIFVLAAPLIHMMLQSIFMHGVETIITVDVTSGISIHWTGFFHFYTLLTLDEYLVYV